MDPARLIEWGLRALSRALEKPGRVRAAAFDLLVADAFLTYACEAMAASGDVGAGLESLIGQLGTRLG